MKNLFIALLFLINLNAFTMELSSTATTQWRKKFKKIDHQRIQDTLGYNPRLRLIEKDDNECVNQGGPSLYIHGWLSAPDALNVWQRCNDSNKIPGDVIVFDFPDASQWIYKTIPYWMPLSKSNFAQENDLKALLTIMKTLHENNIPCPIFYPHSRGGGVVQKSIGILNKPNQAWEKILTELGLTENYRTTILEELKIVYFNTPLKSINLAIQKRCETTLGWLTYLIPSLKPFVSNTVTAIIKNKILPKLTSFNPNDSKEPLEYLADWSNLNITTVLHFQHNDKDVPGEDNGDCAYALLAVNPDKTYVIIGNDGGHEKGDITLARIIHSLNKSLGLSYLNDPQTISNGDNILNANRPCQTEVIEHIDKAIRTYCNQDKAKQWKYSKVLSIFTIIGIACMMLPRYIQYYSIN